MRKKACLLLILSWISLLPASAQLKEISTENLGLVPLPKEVKAYEGKFTLPSKVIISAKTKDELNTADFLKTYLGELGKEVTITPDAKLATIKLKIGGTGSSKNPESYELTVDKSGASLSASAGPGLFYASQTLMQLMPPKVQESIELPYVRITDEPTFKWRGNMLDVARHFFPVSFVKKYIDYLAAYKINTFHWHLTDDQGWRIEIKKYPKLTTISAFRNESLIGPQQLMKKPEDYKYDGMPHGGFYTQEQIKEVIDYAQKRYITIVPEIEMPGHSVAVLAAYPELACKPGPYQTRTLWGISEDIVCPSEQTFQFFEDVLTEVVQLFPGKYVHIGGDEAPKDRWRESDLVKDIMKKEKLKDVEKVQGWFNSRIEKFLLAKGKKLIGWDEILEGGITPKSTIMSWRGEKGGIEAARHGNEVVMSPSTHLYLDHGQNPVPHSPVEPTMIGGYLPLEKVYGYNPLSSELTPEQHKYILGPQANLWTEYITTPEKVEYMLFPRILALSEVAWTPYANKNYSDFLQRLGKQFPRLDAKNILYRVPEPGGMETNKIVTQGDKAILTLTTLYPGSQIRYTLDGTVPNETSDVYTKPLPIPINKNLKVRAITITPNGRHSVPAEVVIP
ncbi:beta-N-acetylhexosaminidase [Adhaeribacter radiodurans]|uniref:beta-N-acetylhexosaminidase n=1 Tax=Adhaeribacter radiodurans TaxID=2745197 RepID=A0A7L7L3E6_9BACT|nr:family 20 glycosylhydrolase [Adhaeribacter radiodurans]QMU27326.1 family 20 glycosylhydrolase [Adhaeribacter radiodurans]